MSTERRYGQWAGNPAGRAENPTKCIESVPGKGRAAIPRQCIFPRGHGPEGLYCKRHDPERITEERLKEQEEQRRLLYVRKQCEEEGKRLAQELGIQYRQVYALQTRVYPYPAKPRLELSYDELRAMIVRFNDLLRELGREK